jgi:hypothetical protein
MDMTLASVLVSTENGLPSKLKQIAPSAMSAKRTSFCRIRPSRDLPAARVLSPGQSADRLSYITFSLMLLLRWRDMAQANYNAVDP